MGIIYLLKGFIIGLLASVPLGPIGVMCIQRTLCKNRRAGFVSGLGAASADTLFAAIAVFSLSVVLGFIHKNLDVMQVVAGISIIIVGMTILFKNPVVQIRRNRAGKGSLWSDYLTVFGVTLTNPALILIFIALFAAMGVSQNGLEFSDALIMLGGVLAGASLWWFSLTFAVSTVRTKFRPRHLLWINRISGALIVTLGAIAILSLFFQNYVADALPA